MKIQTMMRKAALTLLALMFFAACQNILDPPGAERDDELATLSIRINENGGRTISANQWPTVATYKLFKSVEGEEPTELATFDSSGTRITLTPGTYNFILEAYDEEGILVGGAYSGNVVLTTGENSVNFYLTPVSITGNGSMQISLNFPNALGLTALKVKNSALGTEETFDITNLDYYYYEKSEVPKGNYVVHFSFYQGETFVGAASEAVQVNGRFGSSGQIWLYDGDFKTDGTLGVSVKDQLARIRLLAEEGGEYPVNVTADEALDQNYLYFEGLTDVTITLTGDNVERTLESNYGGTMFYVSSGVTLVLGANVTLQGRENNSNPLVVVENNGTLELQEGAKITGNANFNAYTYGGGVYVYSGGTFTMTGGVISGNSSTYGGGVYVQNGGTFNKTGGVIYGSEGGAEANAAGSSIGHAVYSEKDPGFYRNATLNVSDNLSSEDAVNWTVNSVESSPLTSAWTASANTEPDAQQWYSFTATGETQYLHVAYGVKYNMTYQVFTSEWVSSSANTLYTGSMGASLTGLINGATYYLKVTSSEAYKIALTDTEAVPALSAPENVIPISASWTTGNIPAAGGEQWFSFTATGETKYLHIAYGVKYNMAYQVFTSEWLSSSANTLYTGSMGASLTGLTNGDTYYLKVTSSEAYKIALTDTEAVPALPAPENVIPISASWTTGNIPAAGGEQWFSFTTVEEATYYLYVQFGGLSDLNVQFYDSALLEQTGIANLYGSATYTSTTLPAGQTYYVKVWPYSSNGYGDYQLAVNTSSTPPAP